ncbi:hypothetical protein CY35_04G078400 [Sphagnum magellanicum]|nr:hypothetical protein CY35_04G078400 [Sphagnum magellanicum]
MDLDQIQLNNHLCNYLYKWVGKTKLVLEYHKRASTRRAITSQERAFREVEVVVKRGEDLLLKCMCRQSSWLEAAITLANIKDEVLDIVLDLSFWKHMLKIAMAYANMGESTVLQYAKKALEKHEELHEKLLKADSPLQKAADHDRDHLLTKLLEVKEKHASGGEGSTASIQEREYILSIYLLSCIKDGDRIATEVESQLKDIKWGKPLGSGTYGQVSQAEWLQQPCAVKRIQDTDTKEATMARGCNHPHIVQFFWVYQEERSSYIVMERMHEDLSTHIEGLVQRNVEKDGFRPFQLHVAIDIMLQIAKAMRYLHNKKPKKIVHRDLKTSNILVQPLVDNSHGYVHVKLADFGISKFYNRSETSSMLTFRKGTSAYAAPEVFNERSKDGSNSSNLPPKIDVWSFAMVCSEILTGTMPFDGERKVNLHAKIEENDEFRPPLPSDCPEDLRFCITRCWECNPQKRPTFVEICKMFKIAKAQSLGIIHFKYSKLLVSINDPMLNKPRSSNPLTRGASSSSPASDPQAAGAGGGSKADMEGGNGPVDDGKHPQQHPRKPNPLSENGLPSSYSSLVASEGWNPVRSLHVQIVDLQERLRARDAELKAKEEEIKNIRAREKEMKVQLNELQKEKEKPLDQILHLEDQHAAKSLQSGSYLDDSKAATPILLVTAMKIVREVGKKFTKEFTDQLKKCREKVRLALEDHILKQVAVVISRPTHKKYQYQAYMNHKLFIGFDNPTFFMSLDNIDEPPHEFSAAQKSEWYRQDNFQKFQKYDLRKFSVKTLVENAEHDSFLQEFCFMKFQETFDELAESQLFGHLEHRDCILGEKKHPNTPFYESFCRLAVSVWLVHRLAFAFKTPATTFVVEKGLPFDHHKMQSVGPPDDITPNSKVGLVVLPGFQVSQSIIACEVYLVEHA